MRILYISKSVIPSRTANSIHVMKMCQALADNGHEVILLAPNLKNQYENDVDNIYMKSHVTVLSSSYGEAFPNVLAESMLNFTPCIATNVGDTSDILEGVGFSVPIEDSIALADALNKYLNILRDEEDIYYSNCIKCFEKICRYYDIKDIARSYKNLWESLI